MKALLLFCILFITSCAAITWKEKTVHEILIKTTKNRHVRAITEFEVKSVGEGVWESNEGGRWYLNSGPNYRSSYSLNVHLSPKVVSLFSQKYNIEHVSEMKGKRIKVKGTASPRFYCVHFNCPPKAGNERPALYIQTQLLITDVNDISIL